MTVDQLREALATMPGHVPVHVEVPADGGGGHDDSGAAEQAELEAGMRESLAAAGVKPKRGGARVAKVH